MNITIIQNLLQQNCSKKAEVWKIQASIGKVQDYSGPRGKSRLVVALLNKRICQISETYREFESGLLILLYSVVVGHIHTVAGWFTGFVVLQLCSCSLPRLHILQLTGH